MLKWLKKLFRKRYYRVYWISTSTGKEVEGLSLCDNKKDADKLAKKMNVFWPEIAHYAKESDRFPKRNYYRHQNCRCVIIPIKNT